ncbi:Glucosyltransferase-like protein [Dispira simplex]|nr:Glucosyltransferase-like protein [Dispira simplex]
MKRAPSSRDGTPSVATRWFGYVHRCLPNLQPYAGFLSLVFAVYVRWAVALGPYSGSGVSPTYGDYEAQRHWMELTWHLPIQKWYTYSPDYWRLDYPPLSAYVSWLWGLVAHCVDPSWVALETSRGIETPESKLFMRSTVLVCELMVYVSALAVYFRRTPQSSWVQSQTVWLLVLLQPALILIDHGHFQYNAVMLGCVVWALACFQRQRLLAGAVCFCGALMFKQMALYYAPAMFAYLLGQCWTRPRGFRLFIQLSFTVLVTFAMCFAPFLISLTSFIQIVQRIFPVHRGLFEDKVANVWCALNVVVKLRQIWDIATLLRLSAGCTLLALLPSCVNVFRYPTLPRLLYALANCSLAFFLFSFQVHEKSILIPALPITLLMAQERTLVFSFINVGMFSMFTLLQRDGVTWSYAVCTLLWNWLGGFPWNVTSPWAKKAVWFSLVIMGIIHLLEATVSPPERYPHIYIVVNVLFSCGMFGLFFLYLNYQQFKLPSQSKVDRRPLEPVPKLTTTTPGRSPHHTPKGKKYR